MCPACGSSLVARRRRLTRRQVVALLVADLAVIGGAIAIGVVVFGPGVNRAKRHNALVAARVQAATARAVAAQERIEQRLHAVALAPGLADPGAGARASRRVAARAALVGATQAAITAALNAAVRAGGLLRGYLGGQALSTSCKPYPSGSPAPSLATSVGAFACIAVEAKVRTPAGVVGSVGSPVWARLDFLRARLAWCLINPLPGEMAVGHEAARVPLAPACDLTRAAPAGF
jgi:hypothetical protein